MPLRLFLIVRMHTKLLCLTIITLFCSTVAHAQDGYFYGSVKIPLFEYIGYLVNDNLDEDTEGALIDAGYAWKVHRHLALETGVEYFFRSNFSKNYYSGTHAAGQKTGEIAIDNSSFAFQARPVLHTNAGAEETTTIRFGCALNYQQAFSKGTYYGYANGNLNGEIQDNSRSAFFLTVQPMAGINFQWGAGFKIGFDISYINVDWTRSMNKVQFEGNRSLIIPEHKTSNLFISTRFFFGGKRKDR